MPAIEAFCHGCKRPIYGGNKDRVYRRTYTRYVGPHGQTVVWYITMCRDCHKNEAAWKAAEGLAGLVVERAVRRSVSLVSARSSHG